MAKSRKNPSAPIQRKQDQVQVRTSISQLAIRSTSGPLPDAASFAAYEATMPGAGERILAMAEQERAIDMNAKRWLWRKTGMCMGWQDGRRLNRADKLSHKCCVQRSSVEPVKVGQARRGEATVARQRLTGSSQTTFPPEPARPIHPSGIMEFLSSCEKSFFFFMPAC